GLLIFHARSEAVFLCTPPDTLTFKLLNSDGFAFVVALRTWRIRVLVIPDFGCRLVPSKEEQVGPDTGIRIEDAVGKPDDRVKIAVGEERFLYAGLHAFAEQRAVGQNESRATTGL